MRGLSAIVVAIVAIAGSLSAGSLLSQETGPRELRPVVWRGTNFPEVASLAAVEQRAVAVDGTPEEISPAEVRESARAGILGSDAVPLVILERWIDGPDEYATAVADTPFFSLDMDLVERWVPWSERAQARIRVADPDATAWRAWNFENDRRRALSQAGVRRETEEAFEARLIAQYSGSSIPAVLELLRLTREAHDLASVGKVEAFAAVYSSGPMQKAAYDSASSLVSSLVREGALDVPTAIARLSRYDAAIERALAPSALSTSYVFRLWDAAGPLVDASDAAKARRALDAYRRFLVTWFTSVDRADASAATARFSMQQLCKPIDASEKCADDEMAAFVAGVPTARRDIARYVVALSKRDPTGRHGHSFGEMEWRSLLNSGDRAIASRALSELLAQRVQAHDVDEAIGLARLFVDKFPDSSYAWFAAVRLGALLDATGDHEAALGAFQQAQSLAAPRATAWLASLECQARLYERSGQMALALAAYEGEVAAWPRALDREFSVAVGIGSPWAGTELVVSRNRAMARIDQLQEGLRLPAGRQIDAFRLASAEERWADATAAVESVPNDWWPPELRATREHARLRAAVNAITPALPEDAVRTLRALASSSEAGVAFVARVAGAAVMLLRGGESKARAEVATAFSDAVIRTNEPRAGAKASDISEIVRELIRPNRDGVYGRGQSNSASVRHIVLPTTVLVERPNQPPRTESIAPFEIDGYRAVWLAPAEASALSDFVRNLAGPDRDGGAAMPVLNLWSSFLADGLFAPRETVVYSYPHVFVVTFTDVAGTKAKAKVGFMNSSASVWLEKRDGKWVAVRVGEWWVA